MSLPPIIPTRYTVPDYKGLTPNIYNIQIINSDIIIFLQWSPPKGNLPRVLPLVWNASKNAFMLFTDNGGESLGFYSTAAAKNLIGIYNNTNNSFTNYGFYDISSIDLSIPPIINAGLNAMTSNTVLCYSNGVYAYNGEFGIRNSNGANEFSISYQKYNTPLIQYNDRLLFSDSNHLYDMGFTNTAPFKLGAYNGDFPNLSPFFGGCMLFDSVNSKMHIYSIGKFIVQNLLIPFPIMKGYGFGYGWLINGNSDSNGNFPLSNIIKPDLYFSPLEMNSTEQNYSHYFWYTEKLIITNKNATFSVYDLPKIGYRLRHNPQDPASTVRNLTLDGRLNWRM
jgi:hypothetical protein